MNCSYESHTDVYVFRTTRFRENRLIRDEVGKSWEVHDAQHRDAGPDNVLREHLVEGEPFWD
ncbi:hypothetical protein IH992_04000 [Candidatus Poribacteria bacterium]|nr:hypothetical protein [Candidatus Poribacteria bacterium]